jgi:hypothetical protein
VTLGGAVDAIGPMQARVEPLRRVGRHHLAGEHEAKLIPESPGIGLAVEIATFPAPIGPGAGHPIEDLLGGRLAHGALGLRQGRQRIMVRHMAAQPGRNTWLIHGFQGCGNSSLAEILLRQDVAGDLRPRLRHLDTRQAEDDRSIRIANLARRSDELDLAIPTFCIGGQFPLKAHAKVLR